YDSAAVDGATGIRQMIHLAIPLTMSTTRALLILGFIGAINQFGLVFLLSRGGPYHASEVMAYQIYDLAFKTNHTGYASALSIVLLFISAVVTIIQLILLKGRARLFG
ncbi:MAG: ABC transporter permease subunit, partial [Anaerolineae bacterium]|nr:ABC transporter permease subunit [Anaerolineae bacterium]